VGRALSPDNPSGLAFRWSDTFQTLILADTTTHTNKYEKWKKIRDLALFTNEPKPGSKAAKHRVNAGV
jgi:hypothetical protein